MIRRSCASLPTGQTLVVSLGVDTFEGDPISHFKLKTSDYPRMGQRIRTLDVPTLFAMEGGYAVAEIGDNVVGVLRGYENQFGGKNSDRD